MVDARIAVALGGCHRSTVTRARKRAVVHELIAAERKREQARLRQAAKRARDRVARRAESVVEAEPVPASFEDDPGFGQPGSPRFASLEVAGERTGPGPARSDHPPPHVSTPGGQDRSSRQPGADQASRPEIADAQAAAAAAACYVGQLEAAYQHAFAAIETLVAAIERVQQLRGQEQVWEQANTLGVAPKRPEPWHVRAAFDDGFRQLQKRFNEALNSRW